MKAFAIATLFAALSTAGGCASIVSDDDTPVFINSEPAGATYEVRDNAGRMVGQGTTPNTLTLKNGAGYFKRAEYSVLLKKEGYAPTVVPLRADIRGWYWGNLLFGGLIGFFAVDPATGAMYVLPETAFSNLPPLALPATAKN